MRARTIVLLGLTAACGGGSGSGADAGVPDAPTGTADAAGLVGLPAELADEAALAELTAFDELAVLRGSRAILTSSFDRLVTTPPPVNILQNGNRDMNHFVCRGADDEQPRPVVVPFFYDDAGEVCAEPYVKGFVVARAEGSGRLGRFWMTAFSWSRGTTDTGEILRVWIDDAPTPVVEIPILALRDGTGGPMVAPPFGAGSLSRVSWHYPVVWGDKIVIAIDRLGAGDAIYHQTQVQLDVPSRARAAATAVLDEARSIAQNALTYLPLDMAARVPLGVETLTLAPGAATDALTLTGTGTITQLQLTIPAARVADLETLGVRAVVDGRETVLTMAALLFGAHRGRPPSRGTILDAETEGDQLTLALRLPMPYATAATWTLTNGSATDLPITLRAVGEPTLPASAWGHLHVQVHQTIGPTADPTHTLLAVVGRGHVAGVCLDLQGHAWVESSTASSALNFLEGDERIVVDETDILAGTGTEDYLGGAFYFDEGLLADAFAAVWWVLKEPKATPPRGEMTGCRWHATAAPIPFQITAEGTLEIGPAQPSTLDHYRSVAYVYLAP